MSDVDVMFVAEDARSKSKLEHVVYDYATEFHARFGAPLSPIVYDLQEAAALHDAAPALYDSLIRDEVVVVGPGVRRWSADREA